MISPSVSFRHHMTAEQVTSEEAQVRAAQQDPKQFEALYAKYFEPVFRFVYQRVDQKQAAADVTSQVFLKAMLNLSKYEHRGLPFSSWLFRIAKNELTDSFRKKKTERTVNIETAGINEMMNELRENRLDEYQPRLKKILTALKDEDLELVEMRFFEKRSFKEIGDILEITENNAKVRLYRLLERMKHMLTNKK